LSFEDPEVPDGSGRKVGFMEETSGEVERETLLIEAQGRERPRGRDAHGSRRSRPELNLRGRRGKRLIPGE
jgi:hypothetical protein